MNPKYAEMMGYTEEELRGNFKEYVAAIAEERQQEEEEIWEEVRTWYNGYRFTERETRVYNPFSTLNFMDERRSSRVLVRHGNTLLSDSSTQSLSKDRSFP